MLWTDNELLSWKIELQTSGGLLAYYGRADHGFSGATQAKYIAPTFWSVTNPVPYADFGDFQKVAESPDAVVIFTFDKVTAANALRSNSLAAELTMSDGNRNLVEFEYCSPSQTKGMLHADISYRNVSDAIIFGTTVEIDTPAPGDVQWHRAIATMPIPPPTAHHIFIEVYARRANPGDLMNVKFRNVMTQGVNDALPFKGWVDVTCDVRSLRTRYGRERFTSRYDVASFELTVTNATGDYSYRMVEPDPPTRLAGLRPGQFMRGVVTFDGVEYPMFCGPITRLTDSYEFDGTAVTKIDGLDPTSLLGNSNVDVSNSSTLNHWSGNRIISLLDQALLPQRDIDIGQFSQGAIQASGRTLRDEIGVSADSEGGAFFAERDGTFTYRDRTWASRAIQENFVGANLRAAPIDLAMGPADDYSDWVPCPTICLRSLSPDWSNERVVNTIMLANAGSTQRNYTDQTSIDQYGVQTYTRNDFVDSGSQDAPHPQYATTFTPDQMLDLRASDFLTGNTKAMLRVNRVAWSTAANSDDEQWRFTLHVFLNQLVRVWYINAKSRLGYAIVSRVQGVEHAVTATGWETTTTLDQPIRHSELRGLDLGFGWDIHEWDVNNWDDETPNETL